MTYKDLGPLFDPMQIGGLLELDCDYSNDVRRTILTQLTEEMLKNTMLSLDAMRMSSLSRTRCCSGP